MGQDFFNCDSCDEIFGDYSDHGCCEDGCMLCGDCYDSAKEDWESFLDDNWKRANDDLVSKGLTEFMVEDTGKEMSEADGIPSKFCPSCFHDASSKDAKTIREEAIKEARDCLVLVPHYQVDRSLLEAGSDALEDFLKVVAPDIVE